MSSHQGNEGNEEADQLAREGIEKESPTILPGATEIDKAEPGPSASKPIVLDALAPVFESESSEEENNSDSKDPSVPRDHEGINRSDSK